MARKRLYKPDVLEPIADRVWRYLFELQAKSGRRFVRADYAELVRGMEKRFGPPRPTVGLVAESLLLLCRQRRIIVRSERFVGEGMRKIFVLAAPEKENIDVVDEKGPGIEDPAAGGGIAVDTGADDRHSVGGQPPEPPGASPGVEGLADLAGSGSGVLAGAGSASGYAVVPG